MTDPTTLRDLLRSFPFIADQPEPVVDILLKGADLLRYRMGQPVCRPQQSPGSMLFLLKGSCRSVVLARRLPHGVATLQKLGPGALLAWSSLSSGRCFETLIASTECVMLAVPYASIEEAMRLHPPLAQRVRQSVSAAELFSVLDAYLERFPRQLGTEVVKAAAELTERVRVVEVSSRQLQQLGLAGVRRQLPDSDIWLVSAGDLALGEPLDASTQLPDLPENVAPAPLRLLGLQPELLEAQLQQTASASGPDPQTADASLQERLFRQWQLHEAEQRRQQAIADGRAVDETELLPDPDAAAEDLTREAPQLPRAETTTADRADERLPPSAYPHVAGRGPLDSSIAAYRMLADHLGLPFRKELFRRVFGDQVKRHGEVSLALCGAVAESIGLHTQLLQVGAEAVRRLEPPLLLRWGDGLAIVYRSDPSGLVLGIPAAVNTRLSWDEFTEQWGDEGELLTLKVTDRTPKRKFGFAWFLPALQQHRSVLIEVLLASFFVQLFGLVNPLLIQQVIDKAIINASPDAMGLFGLLLVVFALFEGLLLCLRTFLFVDTTNRIDLDLGTRIIDHLLRLPLSYFDRRPVGEVSNRISEMEKIRGFLTGTALTTVLDAFFALLYVVVMLLYSWKLTILSLAVVPVLVGVVFFVSPLVRQQLQKRAVASARTQSHLVEVLSSMMTVKAQNIELRSRWKWQDYYTDYVAEGFDNTLLSTTAGSLNGFLNKLSSLLVIWGGAYMVLDGELTLGELIAFRIIAGYVTGPLLRMTTVWQSVQETALSLERLSDVIDHPEEAPEDNSKRINMASIEGKIEFRDIDFRYQPSSPLLLKKLNLSLDKGQFIAVVGMSGSGKSTLTKLLTRLYAPEKGMVLIDDIDISKVELYSLRRQIGVVPQDTVLFDGSVEENIALTNPEASSEEVIEAARVACAHDFIMALPAGYSNQVGERGSGLSGGQRQRVAIARTILQRPNLLIMDEATSALDYQTERVVCDNLMKALRGNTVLFITHRLSSITGADKIVVMGDGVVLEVGSHDELMRNRGPYFALFRQQGRSSPEGSPVSVASTTAPEYSSATAPSAALPAPPTGFDDGGGAPL